MFTRLSILCFLLFAANTATACSCSDEEDWLKGLESRGFPAGVEIFHGKVERWISNREVRVQVIEAFSGSRETKRLIASSRGTTCDYSGFSKEEVGREVIYVVRPASLFEAGFMWRAWVVGMCSGHAAHPETLDRLRAIAERSNKVDLVARNSRLEAAAAQRAADEKVLRAYKGESLFEPAKEASLHPQLRSALELHPARRAGKTIPGMYVVHVNRLAIDAPVTIFVIDGKEYKFIGRVSTTLSSHLVAWPVWETAYAVETDSWDGYNPSSGDRAEITRTTQGMNGQIFVGDRRFMFGSRGEFGTLLEVDPIPMAEREAKERAREKAAREAAWLRSQAVPNLPPVQAVTMVPKRPPHVFSDAQMCADKTHFLSGLDEVESYPQPPHLRSYLAELRAAVKAQGRELRC
jgi:hypothetical protein